MEQFPSDERKETRDAFLEAIKEFPSKGQIELLQLENGMRDVAQVWVTPDFRDRMFPALEELQRRGYAILKRDRAGGATDVFVAKQQALIAEATRSLHERDERRFGELMGFPKSAIDAFMKQEPSLTEDEEEQLIGFKNYHFWLRFSKQHPEEAKEYLRKNYKLLLEKAPALIDEMLPLEENPDEFKRKVSEFVRNTTEN